MVNEIYIQGVISSQEDFWGGQVCSPMNVREQLASMPDATELLVLIDSPGGEVDAGFSIKNILTSTELPITTRAVGTCASIATVIFLAGKTRQVFNNSQVMIHLPMAGLEGHYNEVELAKVKAQLEAETNRILTDYTTVTGTSAKEIEPFLIDGTYLTSEQAIQLNFATEIYAPIMAINTNKMKHTQSQKAVLALAKILNVDPSTLATTEVVNVNVTTKDGKTLMCDPSVTVDSTATIDGNAAPDATYELENGDMVTVVSGTITMVTPATVDLTAQIEALTAQLAEATTNNETLTAELDNMKATNESVAKDVATLTAHLKTLKIEAKLPATITTFASTSTPAPVAFDKKEEERIKAEKKAKFLGASK
jgi:ATP-dependent Clp protease, protease subunit